MNAWAALGVALGAAAGAPTRYLLTLWLRRRGASPMQATLLVNTLGSLALGMIAALNVSGHASTWLFEVIGIGFCGTLTTFSSFALEVASSLRERSWREATTNVTLSLLLCVPAVWLGWWLGYR